MAGKGERACACCWMQVRARKSELANYETLDMGKPIDEAEWDMVRKESSLLWTAARSAADGMLCSQSRLSTYHQACTLRAGSPPPFSPCTPLPSTPHPACLIQDDVAGCFDYYAGLAETLDSRQDTPIDVGMEEFAVRVRREPLGVVGLITPWNYPMLMATVGAGSGLGQTASFSRGVHMRLAYTQHSPLLEQSLWP